MIFRKSESSKLQFTPIKSKFVALNAKISPQFPFHSAGNHSRTSWRRAIPSNKTKCLGIAREKRGSALLIEKNEPNHPWKISIWDSSSRKQITRREATSEPLEEGWFVRSARVIVGSTTMVTTSFTIGLIDRN